MKLLFVVLALIAFNPLSAEEPATQEFPIDAAHMTLTLPRDWIKIPEKALNNIRQNVQKLSPNIKSNYVAGFAGPKPPSNTPLTLLLVQVLPMNLTPEVFLASAQASRKALAMMRPDLSPKADRAVCERCNWRGGCPRTDAKGKFGPLLYHAHFTGGHHSRRLLSYGWS